MRRYLKWGWYVVLIAMGVLRLAAVPEDMERAKESVSFWEGLWIQAQSSDVFWWTGLAILGMGAFAFDVIPFFQKKWKGWFGEELEIVYDPSDPEGQFGGVGTWYRYKSNNPDEAVKAFIFRIGVKNNTRKTIYAVRGTMEGDLIEEAYPLALRFSRTRELEDNLDPGRMLLMDVLAMSPDPANWPEGQHTLIVRLNGRDTPEAIREFYFDRSRMPAMYAK